MIYISGIITKKKCQFPKITLYEQLYNSSESTEAKEDRDLIENENDNEHEVFKITGSIVKEAACKMKAGKGVVSEGYTSDAILNAPVILYDHLAAVYRSFLVHGTVSLNLLACGFLPLLKNSLKNSSDVNSYRAIAGSSLLLKLFDQVILLLWGDLMTSDYKAEYSTSQCSWFVMEVATHFVRRGTACIATLLDCTKAFD